MELVTIPFGYEDLSPDQQAKMVPICIQARDKHGKPIDWAWFEAVASIHEPLLGLAKTFLNDVWRASEITEAAVHAVWQKHGHDLGLRPSSRIYTAAKWEAQDRKAGCWHSRRGILCAFDDLEEVVRKKVLINPNNYAELYAEGLYFKRMCEDLEAKGLDDVKHMFNLLLAGCNWYEIGRRLGKHPDSSRIRFQRWTRRLLGYLKPKGA